MAVEIVKALQVVEGRLSGLIGAGKTNRRGLERLHP